MTGNMAVDVDCDWQTCNVGRHLFDVDCQSGGLAAYALWTDAQSVDFLQHLFFQLCIERVCIA